MKINQNCVCRKNWRKFHNFNFDFLQFWHNYFRSTGHSVKSMPIKYFISARELLKLVEISKCKCDDLIERLKPKERIPSEEIAIPSKMECVFCGRAFSIEATLILHMEIHLDAHHCGACNTSYRTYDIERHRQTKKHLKNVAHNRIGK